MPNPGYITAYATVIDLMNYSDATDRSISLADAKVKNVKTGEKKSVPLGDLRSGTFSFTTLGFSQFIESCLENEDVYTFFLDTTSKRYSCLFDFDPKGYNESVSMAF